MSLATMIAQVRRAAPVAVAVTALAVAGCGPQGQSADSAVPDVAHDSRSPDHAAPDHAAHDHAAHDHTAHGHAAHGGSADDPHAGHGAHTELPADEPAGFSIYHAGSTWIDQHGQERPIATLEGRVQVVGMVYTNCAYACPRMVLDMKRIEAELGPGLFDRVGFVLVSIDPERDTPERLGAFATGSRLDPDRWTLLHGDDGDILELAALLGVQYRRMADGEFVHSNLLTVLDAEGQVVHRQLGLDSDPTATIAVIRSLAG
jgi:protein SCO1